MSSDGKFREAPCRTAPLRVRPHCSKWSRSVAPGTVLPSRACGCICPGAVHWGGLVDSRGRSPARRMRLGARNRNRRPPCVAAPGSCRQTRNRSEKDDRTSPLAGPPFSRVQQRAGATRLLKRDGTAPDASVSRRFPATERHDAWLLAAGAALAVRASTLRGNTGAANYGNTAGLSMSPGQMPCTCRNDSAPVRKLDPPPIASQERRGRICCAQWPVDAADHGGSDSKSDECAHTRGDGGIRAYGSVGRAHGGGGTGLGLPGSHPAIFRIRNPNRLGIH